MSRTKVKKVEQPTITPGKAGTVKILALSSIAMVNGNEKKFTRVIHDGIVKHWVGIGWVDEDKKADPDLFPVAVP